jgi:translocator protein
MALGAVKREDKRVADGLNWRRVALTVIACEAAGAASAVGIGGETRRWLPELDQPPFQPPGWLFGPVWSVLYGLMGLSRALVADAADRPGARRARRLFWVQLGLNLVWPQLFFRRHRIGWAALDSAALAVAVAAYTRACYPLRRNAGGLLLPYLVWVSFAAVLNAELWRRNRRALPT